MSNEIHPTANTVVKLPNLKEQIQQFAIAQSNEFIECGQTPPEASSIVAYMMIDAAWTVAALGALHDGREPNKEKFLSVVNGILDEVMFKKREAQADTADETEGKE